MLPLESFYPVHVLQLTAARLDERGSASSSELLQLPVTLSESIGNTVAEAVSRGPCVIATPRTYAIVHRNRPVFYALCIETCRYLKPCRVFTGNQRIAPLTARGGTSPAQCSAPRPSSRLPTTFGFLYARKNRQRIQRPFARPCRVSKSPERGRSWQKVREDRGEKGEKGEKREKGASVPPGIANDPTVFRRKLSKILAAADPGRAIGSRNESRQSGSCQFGSVFGTINQP